MKSQIMISCWGGVAILCVSLLLESSGQEQNPDVKKVIGQSSGPFRMDFSFPIHEGVDKGGSMDLQVLNRGLVIVGNDYTLEARRRARENREDELKAIEQQRGNKWVIQKKVDAIMREAFVETYTEYQNLDKAEFFSISSQDDEAYRNQRHPAKVTRFSHSRGNFREYHIARDKVCTSGNYLGNFSYLFMPEPMKSGKTYTITQGDGRKTTFLFDEDHVVSRAIKVNQTGYLPSINRKYAYLGAWQAGVGPVDFSDWGEKPFEVVDADSREVVHTGTIQLLAKNPKNRIRKKEQLSAGEDVYQLDLSGLKAEGDFYIRIRGVGRSWPFHHGQEAYGRGFFIHLRGMFHHRGGHELKPDHTAWPRPLAHEKAYLADYIPGISYAKNPVGEFVAIRHFEKQNPNPPEWPNGGVGGWYDAADYDRRWFHYDAFWDLVLAYELAPQNFTDGQEHTYESGNKVPDILDEAAWGLLCWRNSQRPDGGVSSRLETTTHPSPPNMKPDGRPHHDGLKYYFSAPTREGSLRYAGAALRLARLLKPFDAASSKVWHDSGLRAYAFGMDPSNTYKRDDYAGSGKPLEEPEIMINLSSCFASFEVYLSTGDEKAKHTAIDLYPKVEKNLKWPIKFVRDHYWIAYFGEKNGIPDDICNNARKFYLDQAEELVKHTYQNDYRSPISPSSPWGTSWGVATGVYQARYLVMAWGLTKDPKYLDAAAISADWLQGCNPMGVSWTSGLGYNYPWCFLGGESEEDGVLDPVPGITVWGPNGGISLGARTEGHNLGRYDGKSRKFVLEKQLLPDYLNLSADAKLPEIPYWRRWVQDYHNAPDLQEYTIWQTISPAVLVYGVLMGEGWSPSEELKNMKPRESRYIFGQWMTP